MPWKDVSLMDVRWAFVEACRVRGRTVTAVCEQFGISRKTGYKWLDRYAEAGRGGLADASRRPHTHPTATDPALVALLCAARRQHPTWSARKLLAVLAPAHPAWAWPTRSTGGRLLRAHGLVRARRRAGPAARAGERAGADHARESDMDDGLQGRLSDGRWRAVRAVHAAGWLESLCPAVRCPAHEGQRGRAAQLRVGVPRIWAA